MQWFSSPADMSCNRKVSSARSRLSGWVGLAPGGGLALAGAVIWLLLAPLGGCAASTESEVLGLWEVTSVRNLAKGADQPHRREFHMFGETHQMVILAGGDRPKLSKSLSDMTPDEFQSQQPIGAGLYRYELDGEKIVRTNVVALSAYYEGRSFTGELEVAGDTLVLRDSHSADGDEREWTMRRVK